MSRQSILLLLVCICGGVLLARYVMAPTLDAPRLPITISASVTPTPDATIAMPPSAAMLHNEYQVFQTFNNCGPASLSMALSYYGIHATQEELGHALRPYQNPQGDNDDKSVTLDELARKAREYGLQAYHRPNGSLALIKQFIAAGIPVITRTWLHVDDDIGHFRVIKGYDDKTHEIVQDDSMQGHNVKFSYDDFMSMWQKFNYEYVVLIPTDKQSIAETILGKDSDERASWESAVGAIQESIKRSDTIYDRFNLSVAYYHTGNYQQSVEEYERIAAQLPARTLWYQIEPIYSYFELGQYDKVFSISDEILNHQNRAYSELYLVRGKSYMKQGNTAAAREEFQKAVQYNIHLTAAQEALNLVGSN